MEACNHIPLDQLTKKILSPSFQRAIGRAIIIYTAVTVRGAARSLKCVYRSGPNVLRHAIANRTG